jgi:glycosyltransferase involved in cell wall biosynthesis
VKVAKSFAISILMPCHSLKHFAASIESINAQTLSKTDYEVVVVADRIDIIAAQTILDNSNLNYRILESTKPGIVPALNLGLSTVTSKYIARMDDDDVMLPNRLENQLNYLDTHPDYVLLGGQIELIDESNNHIGYSKYKKIVRCQSESILKSNPIAHPAAMFVRERVVEIGGYRSFLPEDWDLWIRLCELGNVGNLDEVVIKYRVHSSQLSRSKTYQLASARSYLAASYFSRKLGIPDHPASNESAESWLVETSKYLRKESKAFAKLEREFKEDILFNDQLKSIIGKPTLKKCLEIFFRFPRRLVSASVGRFLGNL